MNTPLKNQTVKTRKEHQCFSCYRSFPSGTKMNYWASIYEDEFCSGYTCITCVEIMNMREDPDKDGFPEGYVREMLDKGQTPEQLIDQWKTEASKSLKLA